MPGVALGWLLIGFFRHRRGDHLDAALMVTALIWLILIKNLEPAFALGTLITGLVALAWSQWRQGSPRVNDTQGAAMSPVSGSLLWPVAYALCIIWMLDLHWSGSASNTPRQLQQGPVVCLGDSLTDFGYPQELEKLISIPVKDYGFNGYTTADALKLIPEICAVKPSAVVLEIGGHDYKNGETVAAT